MSQPAAADRNSRTRPLDRVAVALDTSDRARFEAWCATFGPRVGLLKVGLEAFVRWGPRAVETARAHARGVFLDLKLHDIPNTVAGAVSAARDLGVDLLTVHAAGATPMLRAAVEAARGKVRLLAVTLLTHLDEAALDELDLPGELASRAARWAELAQRAGCAGAVCSPHEAPALRARLPSPFLLVTPGVRPAGGDAGDQRRVTTPAAALAAGADYLVIGRPLTGAADPVAALAALERELA
ncbi:MAG TPA: orotidine-5'-phosphate decarboxylase [Thermoanaerobaculia bacterium]|nr:orotidine-5'-phosphate decarboxylase [Thermoanaerobaculia bacterium]